MRHALSACTATRCHDYSYRAWNVRRLQAGWILIRGRQGEHETTCSQSTVEVKYACIVLEPTAAERRSIVHACIRYCIVRWTYNTTWAYIRCTSSLWYIRYMVTVQPHCNVVQIFTVHLPISKGSWVLSLSAEGAGVLTGNITGEQSRGSQYLDELQVVGGDKVSSMCVWIIVF